MRFEGPTTLLLQSRAATPLRDVLSRYDVDEMYGGHAHAPPGAAHSAVRRLAAAAAAATDAPGSNNASRQQEGNVHGDHHHLSTQQQQQPERLHIASVARGAGSVKFEEARDFSAFVGPRATS